MMYDIIVTRHKGLVEFLKKHDLASQDSIVLPHADIPDVRHQNVIGVLPLNLAFWTNTFGEVELDIPPTKRGKELTCREVEKYFRAVWEYDFSAMKRKLVLEKVEKWM